MISSGILELDDGLVSMGYPLAFNQVGIQIARVFKMHEPKFGQVNSKGNRRGGVDFFFFFLCLDAGEDPESRVRGTNGRRPNRGDRRWR